MNQQQVITNSDYYPPDTSATKQLDFETIEKQAVSAMSALMSGGERRTESPDWVILMRPVRASKQACISCHSEAKRGDTLGVMVYSVRKALYQESLAILRELGDRQGIAACLNNLGNVASIQGDFASARSLLEECLEIVRELGHRKGIAESLELIAREDKREHAARLWGAVERLREEIGSPMAPEERDDYNRNLAAAREALSEEAFSSAWREGRAMSMAKAIEAALDEQVAG